MANIKLNNGVLRGKVMPAHIGRAYGRYIFRLLHTTKSPRTKLFLLDLPLSLSQLGYEYGICEPARAYTQECDRVGIPALERVI